MKLNRRSPVTIVRIPHPNGIHLEFQIPFHPIPQGVLWGQYVVVEFQWNWNSKISVAVLAQSTQTRFSVRHFSHILLSLWTGLTNTMGSAPVAIMDALDAYRTELQPFDERSLSSKRIRITVFLVAFLKLILIYFRLSGEPDSVLEFLGKQLARISLPSTARTVSFSCMPPSCGDWAYAECDRRHSH